MIGRSATHSARRSAMARTWSLSLAAGLMATAAAAVTAGAQADAKTDPRVGLKAGWKDAGEAARGMVLIGHGQKPEGFYNPDNLGDFAYLDSDLAFSGQLRLPGQLLRHPDLGRLRTRRIPMLRRRRSSAPAARATRRSTAT